MIVEEIIDIIKNFGMNEADLEITKPEYGDISIPCFKARQLNLKPEQLGNEIKNRLEKLKGIASIEYLNGFLNIRLSPNEKFLYSKFRKKRLREKVLIEHSSINPNASPHIGRARNSIIGDCIARLLKFYGYNVKTHYYVNDIGKQIAMLALSAKGNEKFQNMLKIYQNAAKRIEGDKQFEKEVFNFLEKIELNDKKAIKKIKRIVKKCVNGQVEILKKINVGFDCFDYESDFLSNAKNIVDKLYKNGKIVKDDEGKFVFNLEGSGIEKGMKSPFVTLARPNGTTLYLTRDIAYTIWKLQKAKQNIVVLGEDQRLYFKQLAFILEKLGYAAPKAVHYAMVLVQTKEGPAKMSTRAGTLILLDDFFNEIVKRLMSEAKERKSKLNKTQIKKLASNIIRYTIAKVDYDKNVLFDLEQALKLEGDTAIYLNYSLARAKSILKKIEKKEKEKIEKIIETDKIEKLKIEKLNKFEELLLHKLFIFPLTIERAVKKLDSTLIAKYAYDLCKAFNDFYENCNIIKADFDEKEKRLALLVRYINILEDCFFILGLHSLEKI